MTEVWRPIVALEEKIAVVVRGRDAEAAAACETAAALAQAEALIRDLLDVWDPEWEPGKSLHARAVALVAVPAVEPERGT